jgi:hypothetical protein
VRTHFPDLKKKTFPTRYLSMDFEKDILGLEQILMAKYGFTHEEINFIMKKKPTFLLF